jgi:formate dehydrogenase maturation protein FdhE
MNQDQQILEGLADVQQEAGGPSPLFQFYERLLRAISAKKATLTLSTGQLLKYKKRSTLKEANQPYLSYTSLGLNHDEFYPWLLSMARLFETHDPGAIDEVELVEKEKSLELAEKWFNDGTTSLGSTVDALFANALAPYLERAAELMLPHLNIKRWQQSDCPICGGYPDFSLWDERHHTHQLLCERCRTTWSIMDLGCLFCGEDEQTIYGFYSSEDDLYRVYVCDNCDYYLKTVNKRQARRAKFTPILAVERLLTPGLDLLAAQEGYTRPVILLRSELSEAE